MLAYYGSEFYCAFVLLSAFFFFFFFFFAYFTFPFSFVFEEIGLLRKPVVGLWKRESVHFHVFFEHLCSLSLFPKSRRFSLWVLKIFETGSEVFKTLQSASLRLLAFTSPLISADQICFISLLCEADTL
uniref:Uncharacterized protein n=1 Tax=Physcomitrium patens TaxID=3218 RepID=A0A7I4AU82_PHYPA